MKRKRRKRKKNLTGNYPVETRLPLSSSLSLSASGESGERCLFFPGLFQLDVVFFPVCQSADYHCQKNGVDRNHQEQQASCVSPNIFIWVTLFVVYFRLLLMPKPVSRRVICPIDAVTTR